MKKKRAFLAIPVFIVIVAGLGLLGIVIVREHPMGIKSIILTFLHTPLAVLNSQSVKSDSKGDFTNIIFLHHSVGNNLIAQGGVREFLATQGYHLWDHDYNRTGLRDFNGRRLGYSYIVPDNNTDPDGLYRIFNEHEYGLPLNTFSGLLQHEVIIFKSCFPASNILSDAHLEQYKAWYVAIREVMVRHPEKIFIVLTPPPINPAGTDLEAASRARKFSEWLKSEDFLKGSQNVFTFDLFDQLAENDPGADDLNMLREEYRTGTDSHPNYLANETIGPLFSDFIIDTIQSYRSLYQASRGE